MGIKYILFILLLIPFVSGSIRINEVYAENTSKYEWVELYNYGSNSTNLSGWQFGDSQDNDTINGELILEPGKYALLTSDYTYVYFLWRVGNCGKLYVEGALGYGLNDGGDSIYIYDNLNNTVDSLNYPDLQSNVYSLNESNNWNIVVNGTPGYENFYTNTCDPYINIILTKYIFENETVYFTPKVFDTPNYKIQYWIEDLYSNVIKNIVETDNSNKKQWTSDINQEDKVFVIKTKISYLDCNDINLENNYDEKLIAVLGQEEFMVQDFTKIKINEFLPDPMGNDDAAMPSGEWIELYNAGSSSLDLENLSIKDNYGSEADIFISDSNTIGGTVINSGEYLVVYMNGRSGFLNNNDFEKVYLYKEDYLLDEASYSGSSEGLSWNKIEDKWLLGLPSPGIQNYKNKSDITKSRIKIDSTYDLGNDNKAEFGQMIKVRLKAYKGDTNKEEIKAYIEDKKGEKISKVSSANIGDKFTNYTLTIPIQLIPNCKKKFSDGVYDIVAEGLEDSDREEIEIAGVTESLCEVIKEVKEGYTERAYSGTNESVLNKDFITGSVIYEGGNEKQGEYSVYFFCFALITLILYLLWKNE